MTVSAGNDVLYVKGAHSFLLVASVREAFPLCIEARCEEYIQGVTKEMLTILNLEALLRDERIIVHEEM